MSKAQCCPVCGGRGLVPPNFYSPGLVDSVTNAAWETCRSCHGSGLVWDAPSSNTTTAIWDNKNITYTYDPW